MTEPHLIENATRPCIGVFDSGFGGLTVLDALVRALPGADYLYLGDTARLPYGSKSAEFVTRYTAAAIRFLTARGARFVVIACNTASALALPALAQSFRIPLVGVIEPGARAAANAVAATSATQTSGDTAGNTVLVLATNATVASHAYAQACAIHGLHAFEKACPLLVPIIEEGWIDHPVTEQIARIYLEQALSELQAPQPCATLVHRSATNLRVPAAILLGCTHYPLLRTVLGRVAADLMPPLPIVDSAQATAEHVRTLLHHAAQPSGKPAQLHFFATESPTKFQQLGQSFLRREIGPVTLVDLDAETPLDPISASPAH